MSRLEPTLEPERRVRRIEVITGAGGRRRWTMDDKARIVEETLEPGASVSVVARRHGLTPQQVFAWRREARKRSEEAGPQFVQSCQKVRERIASQVWREVLDGEDAFSVSPDALVEWSPIVDTLKDLDAGIVRNSIRFRWQEIRRDFRADVRPAEILAAAKKMDTQPAA